MEELEIIGGQVKQASRKMAAAGTMVKDLALEMMAQALIDNTQQILDANQIDVDNARKKGIKESLIDRLMLTPKRISETAGGLLQIRSLQDPVGEIVSMWRRPNGLVIGQQRVPIGVVGIIYESRPNVTVDAVGLCIKTGNAVILKGGSDAINSNKAIVRVLSEAAQHAGLPSGCIHLIEDTNRETAMQIMKLNKYIDVLIPRGGAGLIQSVVQNSTIPVIETGVGNCHVYVDGTAEPEMAERIVVNAKTSRPGVCNAAETLLMDETIAKDFLPRVIKALEDKGVEVRGCLRTQEMIPGVKPATEEDYYTEYLDLVMAVKVVNGIDEAIDHINKYGTMHSEAIITSDYSNAMRFQNEVDAAAVYVNASTRFTDGFEFGLGAEIGISTQKLHARGPMGLKELTTTKYIVYGTGQVRE